MEVVRGQIRKGDDVVIDDIEIYLDIQDGGRLKSWSGYFDLEKSCGHDLMDGQFRLVLEDGREGDFFVAKMNIGSHSLTSVYFQGTGALA